MRWTNQGVFSDWDFRDRLRERFPDLVTRVIAHAHPIDSLSQIDIDMHLIHGDVDILMVANNTRPITRFDCYRRIEIDNRRFRIVPWGYYLQTGSFVYDKNGVPQAV